ncbi:MAG: aminotransferase class I/II-fold pyridoxal phosphate-dependent enzyme [Pyrobaculum sp.]
MYSHGGSTWADPPTLDFSDNSNPLGPPSGLEEAVEEAGRKKTYLKFPAHLAEEVLTQYEGIRVVVFNGATEALTAALIRLKPRRMVVPWPNYIDYLRVAHLLGVPALRAGPEEAGEGDVVVMSNPNNPLGTYLKRDEVLDLAAQLRRRGARLLVDESFIDFAGGETAAPDVPVVKSYGKLLAAPGLRVGAWLGDVPQEAAAPWRINSVADYAIYALGAEALKKHRDKTAAYVREETPRVIKAVSRCVEARPSDVHFFVAWGPRPAGVKVRGLESHGMPDAYRVSIKTPSLNRLLIEAICSASRRSSPSLP